MVIDGGLAVDDRGTATFVNDFGFQGVKRFYMIQNHRKGFIRAWHGHKKEAKYVLVVRGTILIGIIPMNGGKAMTHILSDKKPQILYIPPKNFNGFKTLTDDAQVMFFSTSTLEESKEDDIREPAYKWDIWTEEYR